MTLEVFGTGCPSCEKLALLTKKAADRLGIYYDLCKVTDQNDIASRGVIYTPALAVNGETKVFGRVPTEDELVAIMSAVLQEAAT